MKVHAHIDGGSRGNPGPAAAGFIIESEDGKLLHEAGVFIGKATNNVAEYSGLIAALKEALDLGATEIDLASDSELLVKQMSGEYRVKNPGLQPLYQEARQLVRQFADCEIRHVRRENNVRADSVANMAMDCMSDVGGRVE
jgi:ribonuclease HI